MKRPGLAVFVLFFGIALVEAVSDGRWPRILFWVGMALLFVLLDWWGQRRKMNPR